MSNALAGQRFLEAPQGIAQFARQIQAGAKPFDKRVVGFAAAYQALLQRFAAESHAIVTHAKRKFMYKAVQDGPDRFGNAAGDFRIALFGASVAVAVAQGRRVGGR